MAKGIDSKIVMSAIQRVIVEGSKACLFIESGNALGLANAGLTFREPGRYRISMLEGSLGHACAGAVGAALVRPGKNVVLTGDGAMLYTHELSTAVAHQLPVIFAVLNDAKYGSCIAGQHSRGLSERGLEIPRVDFVAYARALGGNGRLVTRARQLEPALRAALRAVGPFVVDIHVRVLEQPLAASFKRFFGSDLAQSGAEPVDMPAVNA
jgi:acetolactate synthase-1/2/3 large subunit